MQAQRHKTASVLTRNSAIMDLTDQQSCLVPGCELLASQPSCQEHCWGSALQSNLPNEVSLICRPLTMHAALS